TLTAWAPPRFASRASPRPLAPATG
ncbi:MAG: hypothetical protein AVDCRST_MAG90-3322, partial [uncultured Microvirga sp.]